MKGHILSFGKNSQCACFVYRISHHIIF